VLAVTSLASLLVVLDALVVSTALSSIRVDLAACAGLSLLGALASFALPRQNVSDLARPDTQAVPAFESDGR
jgi:hypothetical protein